MILAPKSFIDYAVADPDRAFAPRELQILDP
jgi:hypothetical protein